MGRQSAKRDVKAVLRCSARCDPCLCRQPYKLFFVEAGCLFFLRLPIGQYGPVSQLSYPENEKETVQVHLIGARPIVQVRT